MRGVPEHTHNEALDLLLQLERRGRAERERENEFDSTHFSVVVPSISHHLNCVAAECIYQSSHTIAPLAQSGSRKQRARA